MQAAAEDVVLHTGAWLTLKPNQLTCCLAVRSQELWLKSYQLAHAWQSASNMCTQAMPLTCLGRARRRHRRTGVPADCGACIRPPSCPCSPPPLACPHSTVCIRCPAGIVDLCKPANSTAAAAPLAGSCTPSAAPASHSGCQPCSRASLQASRTQPTCRPHPCCSCGARSTGSAHCPCCFDPCAARAAHGCSCGSQQAGCGCWRRQRARGVTCCSHAPRSVACQSPAPPAGSSWLSCARPAGRLLSACLAARISTSAELGALEKGCRRRSSHSA